MSKITAKTEKRDRRHRRIRAKVRGVSDRPRLSVFKSNKYIYAQVIDDTDAKTVVSASSLGKKGKGMMEKAKTVGKEIAEKAQTKKIKKVVFDRGGYVYTGKIKALAEGAREAGLEF